MKKDEILKVTKPRVNYYCENPSDIIESGVISLGLGMEIEELENLKVVLFKFVFKIINSDEEIIENLENNKTENLKEVKANALLEIDYKIILETEKEAKEVTKNHILSLLEAYIRKDVMDFYGEVELPNIKLPNEIWEHSF